MTTAMIEMACPNCGSIILAGLSTREDVAEAYEAVSACCPERVS